MTNIQKIIDEFEKLPHYRIFLKDQSNFLRQALNQIRQETLEEMKGEIMERLPKEIKDIEFPLDNYEHPKIDQAIGYNEAITDIINLIKAKKINI